MRSPRAVIADRARFLNSCASTLSEDFDDEGKVAESEKEHVEVLEREEILRNRLIPRTVYRFRGLGAVNSVVGTDVGI